MNKLLTINDIANLAQVTRKTVVKWIKAGGLKANKVGGTSWRITERDLKIFLNRREK